MKIAIEISDSLLAEAKALVRSRGVTMRHLVEDGLREGLRKFRKRSAPFCLKDGRFTGEGLQETLTWPEIRQQIYEGRGE